MTLSVIVPVYNVAAYLKPCLESIFAAAKKLEVRSKSEERRSVAVEVICVDDGSTDGSAEILEEIVSSLGFSVQSSGDNSKLQTLNFKLIHQQNAGVSAARNAALDVATGDWIGFVDADDTVDECWFCRVVEVIGEASAADVVYLGKPVSVRDETCPCGAVPKWWLPLSEAQKRAALSKDRMPTVHVGGDARRWGLQHYARYGWPVSNFVRRELIGDVRFPVGVGLKEDVCFFIQIGNRVSCVAEVDFPGYFYTRRDGSAVMRHRSDEDSLKFVNAMLALISSEFGVQSSESKLQTLNSKLQTLNYRQAVSTAIGYEFVQWAEERDPKLPYDPKTCPIRAAWRKAWDEGLIDLGDMPFFWRPCIWLWVRFGILWPAKITRRTREWMGRFI